MAYWRIIWAALLSNGLVVGGLAYLLVFQRSLIDPLFYQGWLRLCCLIGLLIVQAWLSRYLFRRLGQINLTFTEALALLFVADFLLIFLLALIPLVLSVKLALFFLLASWLWAKLIDIQYRWGRTSQLPPIDIVGGEINQVAPEQSLYPFKRLQDHE